jgi:exopolyphosphatase / guanosine-5'-triphosphate,3'-diphosphate pyrophosphatase
MSDSGDTRGVCGLDIGSNTFSYCVVEERAAKRRVVRDASVVVRLSEGLRPGGVMHPRAVERGLETLEDLTARDFSCGYPVRAVGTAVLRMARNREDFTRPAREALGVEIEVIDGETEARLTARGAVLDLPGDGPWVLADVGGQSTELASGGGRDWEAVSLDLGVVGLSERFLRTDPPTAGELGRLRAAVREMLTGRVPFESEGRFVGVAGTATTLGMLASGRADWDRDSVHGLVLSRASLETWLARMVRVTTQERTARYGVRPGRADVFPAGICVLAAVADRCSAHEMMVSANGLRVGVALSALEGDG